MTDNYDDDVALTASGSVDVNTAGTYTLTYTGEDSSKNQAAPVTRTIEVVDLVAPVIVLNGASSVSHQVGSAYTDAGSTVTDNIDDDLSATVAGSVDVNTLGTYTLSFSATDSSGNKAATVTRTITVVDSAPPLITLLGDADMTIALGSTFTDPFATAEDAQDGSVDVVVIGEADSNTAGTYTLTYTASDGQGNQADPVTRTVNVEVVDNDPVIALVGDASMSIDLGSTFTEPGGQCDRCGRRRSCRNHVWKCEHIHCR